MHRRLDGRPTRSRIHISTSSALSLEVSRKAINYSPMQLGDRREPVFAGRMVEHGGVIVANAGCFDKASNERAQLRSSAKAFRAASKHRRRSLKSTRPLLHGRIAVIKMLVRMIIGGSQIDRERCCKVRSKSIVISKCFGETTNPRSKGELECRKEMRSWIGRHQAFGPGIQKGRHTSNELSASRVTDDAILHLLLRFAKSNRLGDGWNHSISPIPTRVQAGHLRRGCHRVGNLALGNRFVSNLGATINEPDRSPMPQA